MTDSRTILIGMGSGRCGTKTLARLLDKQPAAQVTHEQAPLLDWYSSHYKSRAEARLNRLLDKRKAPFVGDVASFYLPYARSILQQFPNARLICLKRERAATIKSFCRWVDRVHPLKTDHWSENPQAGFFHEPNWTRIFPKYQVGDRAERIGLYWDEYYQRAEELSSEFEDRFRIVETETLSSTKSQAEILEFCGFAKNHHVVEEDAKANAIDSSHASYAPASFSASLNDPKRCVVIVPHGGSIDPGCDAALRELERRGYRVRRVGGYAAIDQGRNQMATDALVSGFEETMWIDSDVVFEPESVERLRSHGVPISSGIYPQKGKQAIASHVIEGTPSLEFGSASTIQEILYAAAGFMHVRRSVYERMQHQLKLPVCNERFGKPMIPFFEPQIIPHDDGHWYLAEDFSFCHRARQCGFRVFADPSIRLWHVGNYRYGWEDAGVKQPRHEQFTLSFDRKHQPGQLK